MNLFTKQIQNYRLRERIYSYQWGEQEKVIEWEFKINMNTHTVLSIARRGK